MATWTDIANASLEPGAPARSVDAFALRDNPVAIAEGAAGAPKIEAQALDTSADEMRWVGARIAQTTATEIGAIIVAWNTTTSSVAPRGTITGSNLRYQSSASLGAGLVEPISIFSPINYSDGISTTFPTTGTSALSGTWLNLGGLCRGRALASQGYCWFPSIWIRVE